MKQDIEQLLHAALARLKGDLLPADVALDNLGIERTRDPANGDFASNIAMKLAKQARKPPRELAQAIIAADKEVSHGRVVWLIDLVRNAGVYKFALNIDPAAAIAAPK